MKRILLIFIILCCSYFLQAQVPREITYQGVLLGTDEMPVSEGNYRLTFTLYDEPGNPLWTEVHDPVFIGGGLFHVILGSNNPLNLPFNEPYFLGIKVGNDPELQPRMFLASVPYALRAEETNSIAGFPVNPTPAPNTLLPLDGSGKFPASVLPSGGGSSGNYLQKDTPENSTVNDNNPVLGLSNQGNGVGLYGHSVNGYGLQSKSDNNHGIHIPSAGKAGIHVENAGTHGVHVKEAAGHGFDVAHTKGNGLQVYSADGSGIRVASAVYDALMVDKVKGNGVQVIEAGHDGLRVVKAGMHGLHIYENVTGDYIYAGSDANPQFRVTNNGTAYADGGWQGAADFAELIETDGLADRFEPGDVMVISEAKDRAVTASTDPYSTRLIGVYSTKPGFVGSVHPMQDRNHNEIPVAITGIVPCKVTAENGPIQRGDLLTSSSLPGHAMKATTHRVGTIIGKAMQALASGTGKIEILIMPQ
jgi:hypothetical protein